MKKTDPCWIEVRPLISGKFDVGNSKGILDYLHNTGKPFRFCAVNCPSAKVEGLRCVRFYIQLETKELAERLATVLRSSMDVEVVVGSQPPEKIYSCCAELGLKNHYAAPLCSPKQRLGASPVDVMIGVLCRRDSAVEVLAVGDVKARAEILRYVQKMTGKTVSFLNTLLNAFVDVFTSLVFGPPPQSKPKTKELGPVAKEMVEVAGWKANQNLFRCEIRLYGDNELIEAIREALPSTPMNGFKAVKKLGPSFIHVTELWKPRGREVKADLLSRLWYIPPALYCLAWLFFRVVDPLRLANADIFSLVLTMLVTAIMWQLFQKKPPLVLSTDELSLIVGLPTAVDKLPVETGTTRVTREQFTFGEKPSATMPISEAPKIAYVPKEPEEFHVEWKTSITASADKPIKIVGVLRDPETGRSLPNRELEVYDAEGNLLFTDFSDDGGRFEIIYTPEKPEVVKLEIRAKGCKEPSHIIEVSVM